MADEIDRPTAVPSEHAPPIELTVPALLSGAGVLFPALLVPVVTSEEHEIRSVDAAASSASKYIAVVAQQPSEDERFDGAPRDVGSLATVVRMAHLPGGPLQALLRGYRRVRVLETAEQDGVLQARVVELADVLTPGPELDALAREALSLFQEVAKLSESIPQEAVLAAQQIVAPGGVADFIAANTPLKPADRYALLRETDVAGRLRALLELLRHELQVLKVGAELQSQVRGELSKRERDYYLREQLKAIQKELGESEGTPEVAELRRRIDGAGLPDHARKEAERELERLNSVNPASPEYQVIRTYLEWLADLPWNKSTRERIDLRRAQRILDADHYGLEEVKQRVLDYLAVRKLRRAARGPILCFVGPPGVGKTSLGKSIARAIGRQFVRLSLGGVRDEAEIRGHRRTYVGAMPGRIIQEIRRAGVNNPLMMLDEVDKLGVGIQGDPAAALLEVLDPAQNSTFVDHYLDLPWDLSKTMFITTANQLDTIPGPLRDRMEVITISGYTEREKVEIARRYLVPRQVEENGLTPALIELTDGAFHLLVRGYTREAGVRNLERLIGALCRRVARKVALGERTPHRITPEQVPELLERPPVPEEEAQQRDEVGVATGLAATAAGGDVLFVEAAVMPGSGKLTLTGQLGEVMQESAQAAFTYVRACADHYGIGPDFFSTHDIHVHVPAGAVPKDGPSAGVTMATAVLSAVARRPIRHGVAMTGEITLRGKVMPVGAIKDKLLAAHRAGVRTVCIPAENERDLRDIPADVRAELDIRLCRHADEVLDVALVPAPRPEPLAATPR